MCKTTPDADPREQVDLSYTIRVSVVPRTTAGTAWFMFKIKCRQIRMQWASYQIRTIADCDISPESFELWHPHNWPVTTTNHKASIFGQLPGTSKGVCVCLNITNPGIPLLIKPCLFSCSSSKKHSNDWIQTKNAIEIEIWSVFMSNISQVILVRTDSNLCRRELPVHGNMSPLLGLIALYKLNATWGIKVKLWLPLCDYTKLWMSESGKIFSWDLLITRMACTGNAGNSFPSTVG